MSNKAFYIPSGGVGEIEFDKEENKCYKMRASEINEGKTIPLLRLIINLVGICSKHWRNQAWNGWYERYFDLAREIFLKSNGIAKSYALTKDYTEELFGTGDIHTISYCLEV